MDRKYKINFEAHYGECPGLVNISGFIKQITTAGVLSAGWIRLSKSRDFIDPAVGLRDAFHTVGKFEEDEAAVFDPAKIDAASYERFQYPFIEEILLVKEVWLEHGHREEDLLVRAINSAVDVFGHVSTLVMVQTVNEVPENLGFHLANDKKTWYYLNNYRRDETADERLI